MLLLRNFSRVFSIIGSIMAFVTVVIIGLIFLNDGVVQFIPTDTLNTLKMIKEYAVLFTLIVVGMSFACKRSILLFVPFVALSIAAVAFSFPALF